MRRWASIILFVIGGFCVGMQVMIGFMHVPPEHAGVSPLIEFTAIAALFLFPATLLSPGRRWGELGKAMLIGEAVCIGSFAVTLAAPVEEGGVGGLGPLKGYVDWTQGWLNAGAIAAAGLLLMFVGGTGPRPVTEAAPEPQTEGEMDMKGNAPWPVTIVAVILIVAAFTTLGALSAASEDGKALAAAMTSSYESAWLPWAGALVAMGCAVGMFLGWPMARILFVVWMGWGVLEGLLFLDEPHFDAVVTGAYALIAILLFLPVSSAWFRKDYATSAETMLTGR